MKRNVIWIASYPKSGNTWVRFIVSTLLKGDRLAVSGEIEKYTPDVHKFPLRTLPSSRGPLFLKTHWKLHRGIPHYKKTRKAIYIVRHPGDTLVSNLEYLKIPRRSYAPMINQFIRNGGLEHWQRFGIGTWTENVDSWCRHKHPFPKLILSYEDLASDTSAQIARIADFIGHPVSREQADAVAKACAFDSLQKMEIREKSRNVAPEESFFIDEAGTYGWQRSFMRSGQKKQYVKYLEPYQINAMQQRFAEYMKAA